MRSTAKLVVLLGLLSGFNVMAQEVVFPSFEQLQAPVLMPANPQCGVAADGNFTINGAPRYLIGTFYYDGVKIGYAPTSGYPETLKWIYEQPLDYRNAQRIGFDSTGVHASDSWLREFNPAYRSFLWNAQEEKTVDALVKNCREPVYLDYSCFPWTHGAMPCGKKGSSVSDAARNYLTAAGDGNHWMAYSATTPEGRLLYAAMWRSGARAMLDAGCKPFVYELFNEPDYNDWSPYNRDLFVARLQQKYRSLDELNRSWHTSYRSFAEIGAFKRQAENPALYVEWSKFMEDAFIDLCVFGVKAIREVDRNPEAGFCVQPMIMKGTNVNSYRLSLIMNRICSSTGGGSFLQAHFLRAIADGKPIFDGETYLGKSPASVRNALLTQYSRGFNASYVFKWDKRAWDSDWGKDKDAAGGKRVGEKFPYLLLNPYDVPTVALTGIMTAKRDIFAVSDLFTPRDRGIKREIALLRSYPTERLAPATGATCHNFIDDYAAALEYSHFPIDVILEEQLASGRQERYKVLVAAGVNSVYDATPGYLEKFVSSGGTLILGLEALQLDEHGFARQNNRFPGLLPGDDAVAEIAPLRTSIAIPEVKAAPYRRTATDASWQAQASLNGAPAVVTRPFGRGRVIFINARMASDSLGLLLTALLEPSGIKPSCRTVDAATGKPSFEIEITKAVRNGITGYILANRSLSPQLVRFSCPEAADPAFRLCSPSSKTLLESRQGEYILFLAPDDPLILVGGTADALIAREGALKNVSFAEQEKKGQALLTAAGNAVAHKAKAFHVDTAKVKMLDLRRFANRGFVDKIPGDGKGGWTDQGENSLQGMPWGVIDAEGVPFNIIRYDHNEDRTCIILRSQRMQGVVDAVRGIPVDTQAASLYFLHASAWTEGGVAFNYVVHYADGSRCEIPIRGNNEVGDWYNVTQKTPGMKAVPGWSNSKKQGLYVYQWRNPSPEKNIVSLDVVSANGNTIPIIVAVTAGLPGSEAVADGKVLFSPGKDKLRTRQWSGVEPSFEGATMVLRLNAKAKDWGGVGLTLERPVSMTPEMVKSGKLEFYVNGLDDVWGKHCGGLPFQVKLDAVNGDGQALSSEYVGCHGYISGGSIDGDPASWQKVSIPLKQLVNGSARNAVGIWFQCAVLPSQRAGMVIRDVRLVSDVTK